MTPVFTSGRLPALDGVRGFAILAVLLFHFIGQTATTNAFEAAVNRVLSLGVLGVDLFFVLSGFLITGILYDSRAEPAYFRSFYMRRLLRIFPLYYGVLLALFVIVPAIPGLAGEWLAPLRERQAWAWLYGVNIALARDGAWSLSYIEHFWSLAVEEHFYLVWPVVVWALADRPRALIRASLGLAAFALLARVAAALAGMNSVALAVLTPFQLDALCLGGAAAVFVRQPGGEERLRRALVPVGLAALAVLAADGAVHRFVADGVPALRALRTSVFRVLCACLVLFALFAPAASRPGRLFGGRVLGALGKYSYGLYVYHHFFSYTFVTRGTEFALAPVLGSHTAAVLAQAAAGMAASFAVAWLSYEMFERHFLELKRHWPSSRRKAMAVPAPLPAAP
jgi:peptidoglycan/LPS O-acetylase OafA/YrhL